MQHRFSDLERHASNAASIFSRSEFVEGLPFLHSYPRSSSEIASGILADVLSAEHPESLVEVAMAYSKTRDEWHFWVEVDEVVVDVTAHQFPGFQAPLVCAKPSPLEAEFPEVERLSPNAAADRMPCIRSELARAIARRISSGAA